MYVCGVQRVWIYIRLGPGRMEVPGNQTRCVCVQIIDDSCFRGNRTRTLCVHQLNQFPLQSWTMRKMVNNVVTHL